MDGTFEPYLLAMRRHFAPRLQLDRWWPGRSRFEVIVGAILVQNTSWTNVTLAMANLRRARKLSLDGVRRLAPDQLGALIRSSGLWRQKAHRLHGFIAWLDREYAGSLSRMFARPTAALRQELLALDGFGEETADAVLLFAGGHARFILDAYTRRIIARHGLTLVRRSGRRREARRFRHAHALLVETAKHYCRKRDPECAACPLLPLLPPRRRA